MEHNEHLSLESWSPILGRVFADALAFIDQPTNTRGDIRLAIFSGMIFAFEDTPLGMTEYLNFRKTLDFLSCEQGVQVLCEAADVSIARLGRERDRSLLELAEVKSLAEKKLSCWNQVSFALGLFALAWQFAVHPHDICMCEEDM